MVREKNYDLVIVTHTFFTFFQCEKKHEQVYFDTFLECKEGWLIVILGVF